MLGLQKLRVVPAAFLVCTLLSPQFVSGSEVLSEEYGSYTVCQKFKGTFNPITESGQALAGPPGKRGAKGDKGSLGNVEESEVVRELAAQLQAITECSGLYKNGICYFLLEEKVTHEVAISRCQSRSGRLAVIENKQLYGTLWRFVYDGLVRFSSTSHLQFWIDGAYENEAVTLSDSRTAPFLLWYPTYPKSPSSEIHMAFEVKRDNQMDSYQHMFNINRHHPAYPLCQKP